MTRETVGKLARDLLLKEPETTDPIELQRAMHEDYVQNVSDCVDRHKDKFTGNFFVVVTTKKERLMQNVIRNYFYARQSCPTPNYDDTVYLYNRVDDALELLWTLPSQDASHHLKDNALQVAPEEKQLLQYVLDFADGTLFKLAKKLNGETDKTGNLLEN